MSVTSTVEEHEQEQQQHNNNNPQKGKSSSSGSTPTRHRWKYQVLYESVADYYDSKTTVTVPPLEGSKEIVVHKFLNNFNYQDKIFVEYLNTYTPYRYGYGMSGQRWKLLHDGIRKETCPDGTLLFKYAKIPGLKIRLAQYLGLREYFEKKKVKTGDTTIDVLLDNNFLSQRKESVALCIYNGILALLEDHEKYKDQKTTAKDSPYATEKLRQITRIRYRASTGESPGRSKKSPKKKSSRGAEHEQEQQDEEEEDDNSVASAQENGAADNEAANGGAPAAAAAARHRRSMSPIPSGSDSEPVVAMEKNIMKLEVEKEKTKQKVLDVRKVKEEQRKVKAERSLEDAKRKRLEAQARAFELELQLLQARKKAKESGDDE